MSFSNGLKQLAISSLFMVLPSVGCWLRSFQLNKNGGLLFHTALTGVSRHALRPDSFGSQQSTEEVAHGG